MRRTAWVALLAALLVAFGAAVPALAQTDPQPAESRLAEAEARLGALNGETARATERFNSAHVRLDQAGVEEITAALALARLHLRAATHESSVKGLAVAAYKRGPASVGALFNAADITALSDRNEYLTAVNQEQRDALESLKAARSDAESEALRLRGVQARAQGELRTIDAERVRVEALLAEQQRVVGEFRAEVAELRVRKAAEEAEARRLAEEAEAARLAEEERAAAEAAAAEVAEAARQAAAEEGNPEAPAERAPAEVVPQVDESTLPTSPGAATAVQWAEAQLGKPYRWAGAGPDDFDCSGLTQYVWGKAGVYLPHAADYQYYMFPPVPRDQLQPGDLVYFGADLHHNGIYVGNGVMIHAPQTGDVVSYQEITRQDYFGANRPG